MRPLVDYNDLQISHRRGVVRILHRPSGCIAKCGHHSRRQKNEDQAVQDLRKQVEKWGQRDAYV